MTLFGDDAFFQGHRTCQRRFYPPSTGFEDQLEHQFGPLRSSLIRSELEAGDAKVSSTRLREALENGQLDRVKSVLGRNFSIMGTVEFGKGIATSELYYPTANIESQNEVFPPNGIYAAKACLSPDRESPKYYSGVLYLGQSPTFIDNPPEKPYVEINIFDFSHDIYGQTIEVELIKFLRDDQKFDSVSELRDQIKRDVRAAKDVLLKEASNTDSLNFPSE